MLSNIDLNSTIVSKDRKVSRAKTSKLANLLNPTQRNLKNAMPSRAALKVLLIEAKELRNQQQEKQQLQSKLRKLKEAAVDAIMEKNKTIEMLQHTLKNTEIQLNMRTGIDTTQIQFHLSAIQHLHLTIRNLQKSHQEEIQIKSQAIQQMEEQKDQIKFKIYQLQAFGLMKQQRFNQLEQLNKNNRKALSQLNNDAQKINIRLSQISRILDSGPQKVSDIYSQVQQHYNQKSGVRVRDIYQERARQHRQKIQQLKQYYQDYIREKVSLTKSINVQVPELAKIKMNRISIADSLIYQAKSQQSVDYDKCAMSLRHQISSIGIEAESYNSVVESNRQIEKKSSIFGVSNVEKVEEIEKITEKIEEVEEVEEEKRETEERKQVEEERQPAHQLQPTKSTIKSASAHASTTLTAGIAVVVLGTCIFFIKKLRDP